MLTPLVRIRPKQKIAYSDSLVPRLCVHSTTAADLSIDKPKKNATKPKTVLISSTISSVYVAGVKKLKDAQLTLEKAQAAVDSAKSDAAAAAAAKKVVEATQAQVIAITKQQATLGDLSKAIIARHSTALATHAEKQSKASTFLA